MTGALEFARLDFQVWRLVVHAVGGAGDQLSYMRIHKFGTYIASTAYKFATCWRWLSLNFHIATDTRIHTRIKFLYWFTKVQVLNIISLSALIYFSFLQTPALIFLLIYSQVLIFIDFHNRAVLWWQLADFHDNDNRRKKIMPTLQVWSLLFNKQQWKLFFASKKS